MITEDTYEWARAIDKYIDDHSISYIVIKIIVLVISVVGIILKALDIVKSFPMFLWILLILVLFTFMIMDTFHAKTAKNRRLLLIRSDRILQSTIKIIRTATDLTPSKLIVSEFNTKFDINEKGDVDIEREMKLKYFESPAYWIKIIVGVIDGSAEDKPEDLNIEVTNPMDKGTLPWTTIENQPELKTLAILLDPPLKNSADETALLMNLRWREAYCEMINGKEDCGRLTIDNFTERVKMVFIAPEGFEFVAIRFRKGNGELQGTTSISKLTDDRSVLEWTAENIQPNKYPYVLITKKMEPH